jgi:hypothetical protein
MKISEYKYITFQRARVGDRVIAIFIDCLYYLVLIIIWVTVIKIYDKPIYNLICNVTYILLYSLYYIFCYKIFKATLGEKFMSLRLLDINNNEIKYKQIILRMTFQLFFLSLNLIINHAKYVYEYNRYNIGKMIGLYGFEESVDQIELFFSKDFFYFSGLYMLILFLPLIMSIINFIIFFSNDRYR